jgi:hypothetical protein
VKTSRWAIAGAALSAGLGQAITSTLSGVAVMLTLGVSGASCPTPAARRLVALVFVAMFAVWLGGAAWLFVRRRWMSRGSAAGSVLGGLVGAATVMLIVRTGAAMQIMADLLAAGGSGYGQELFALATVAGSAATGSILGGRAGDVEVSPTAGSASRIGATATR